MTYNLFMNAPLSLPRASSRDWAFLSDANKLSNRHTLVAPNPKHDIYMLSESMALTSDTDIAILHDDCVWEAAKEVQATLYTPSGNIISAKGARCVAPALSNYGYKVHYHWARYNDPAAKSYARMVYLGPAVDQKISDAYFANVLQAVFTPVPPTMQFVREAVMMFAVYHLSEKEVISGFGIAGYGKMYFNPQQHEYALINTSDNTEGLADRGYIFQFPEAWQHIHRSGYDISLLNKSIFN